MRILDRNADVAEAGERDVAAFVGILDGFQRIGGCNQFLQAPGVLRLLNRRQVRHRLRQRGELADRGNRHARRQVEILQQPRLEVLEGEVEHLARRPIHRLLAVRDGHALTGLCQRRIVRGEVNGHVLAGQAELPGQAIVFENLVHYGAVFFRAEEVGFRCARVLCELGVPEFLLLDQCQVGRHGVAVEGGDGARLDGVVGEAAKVADPGCRLRMLVAQAPTGRGDEGGALGERDCWHGELDLRCRIRNAFAPADFAGFDLGEDVIGRLEAHAAQQVAKAREEFGDLAHDSLDGRMGIEGAGLEVCIGFGDTLFAQLCWCEVQVAPAFLDIVLR